MPRRWMIAVPGFAFAVALAGCGDLCSNMEPMAAPPAAPARMGDLTPAAPPPSTSSSGATAVSCLAGGFPNNTSRLNNVDKACLDDVAQRLQSDPRAHVVVIGLADGSERDPDAVAGQRARAVQDYLVHGSGVERYRVQVRAPGPNRRLETGADDAARSQNRRCEVWFVPEGAHEPD